MTATAEQQRIPVAGERWVLKLAPVKYRRAVVIRDVTVTTVVYGAPPEWGDVTERERPLAEFLDDYMPEPCRSCGDMNAACAACSPAVVA